MNLRDLLKAKRFNGSSLARELKVSPATVHLWLKGETEPNAETIKKIAELCLVNPTTVFNAVLKTKEQREV